MQTAAWSVCCHGIAALPSYNTKMLLRIRENDVYFHPSCWHVADILILNIRFNHSLGIVWPVLLSRILLRGSDMSWSPTLTNRSPDCHLSTNHSPEQPSSTEAAVTVCTLVTSGLRSWLRLRGCPDGRPENWAVFSWEFISHTARQVLWQHQQTMGAWIILTWL